MRKAAARRRVVALADIVPDVDRNRGGAGVADRIERRTIGEDALGKDERRNLKQRRRRHLALGRSEEHTSELQSLMRISYAVFCLKKKKNNNNIKYEKNKLKPHT